MLLLAETALEGAMKRAERYRREIAVHKFTKAGHITPPTMLQISLFHEFRVNRILDNS